MRWIFVPFDTLYYQEDTANLVQSYEKQYGSGIKVVYKSSVSWTFGTRSLSSSTLKDVKDDELLIIVGHGDTKKDKIGVTEGSWGSANKAKTIVTANELALMLSSKGLPKSHVLIKTTSCCGGGLAQVQEGGKLGGPLESPCFASVLARALFKMDPSYRKIIVGGYPGYMIVCEGYRKDGSTRKHNAKIITVRGQNTDGNFPGRVLTADPTAAWPAKITKEAHTIWYKGSDGLPIVDNDGKPKAKPT
jgi:hypothetical protein